VTPTAATTGLCASLAAVVAGLASSALAATPPTGDARAIAAYHAQARAYAALPGARIVETGYFFVRKGAGTAVDYWWGSKPPAGYVAATATITARLDGGRIVAYLAVLKAANVRPLRILMAGASVFSSTTRCWNATRAGSSPLGTGTRYVFNDGGARFSPPARGSVSTTTFSYTWTAGARATETDVFASTPPSRVKVTIEVAGSQPLAIHKSITPLRRAPALPVPSPPRRPVPKPLCS
jgi:hypothetical protein